MRKTHARRHIFLAALLLLFPNGVAAQNANDIISLFSGLAQTAIFQTTLFEWKKLPKDELACIDRTLKSRGDSIQGLISRAFHQLISESPTLEPLAQPRPPSE